MPVAPTTIQPLTSGTRDKTTAKTLGLRVDGEGDATRTPFVSRPLPPSDRSSRRGCPVMVIRPRFLPHYTTPREMTGGKGALVTSSNFMIKLHGKTPCLPPPFLFPGSVSEGPLREDKTPSPPRRKEGEREGERSRMEVGEWK